MNKSNRILSTVLIAVSIGLLFGTLILKGKVSGIEVLNLPSYRTALNVNPISVMAGIAAVFGILGGLFAWLKVQIDNSEEIEKARWITEDVTRGLKKKESPDAMYLDGKYVMINQDVTETSMMCVLSAEKTEAVSEETIAIAESEEK